MNKIVFFLFAVTLWMACGGEGSQSRQNPSTSEDQHSEVETYGEVITPDQAISIDNLVEQLAVKDSLEVKVAGHVTAVCQAKGCWMEMTNGTEDGESLFVQFKDYGFFMPKDLDGSDVVIRGKAYRSVTSVEELRHYAEDEGLSQEEIEAITEPEEELKFMADGVIVTMRG